MLIKLRKGKRAQSLVIVALSATALFGIIALGLDAGRLYFQRRDVQNAADAGALAGAQELIPTGPITRPTNGMIASAGCQASVYALKGLLDTPKDGSGNNCNPAPPAYSPGIFGGGISEPALKISATVQVWTPSRNNDNEIHVRVTYNVPLTFAAILGFSTSAVVADAYAHGGFYNKTYTVFGFDSGGSGNSINYDQNGNAQIDDGNNGSDICQASATQGKMVSNAKWHAPNPGGSWLDMNGQFFYTQASDTHALTLYWYSGVTTAQGLEPTPNYEAPLKPTTYTAPGLTNYKGKTVHVIYPGLYTAPLTIPFSPATANDLYRFMNGVYYFQNANFTITGGTVSNTLSGQPVYGPYGGISDLPNASDQTNGVEFVFDGNASFSATTSGGTSPSVFFAAPSFVSSGTDSIAFFIKATDTISGPSGTPWVEQIDGTKPSYGGYPFQIWGTIYNADTNGSHGTGVVIQAVSTTRYAVNGEVASPQVDLDGGNLPGTNVSYTPSPKSSCPTNIPNGYYQNTAGYLVQFNSHYVPHFRGYAYLVK
jgi:Flp pilus assembly protein TadG